MLNNFKKIKSENGQAVMISTVFFMVISVIVILGVAIPVSKQIKIASDLHKSRISFYVAEAGIDDAIFRVAKGYDVGSEEFNFASSTAEITVTDTANGKLITVESDFQSYIRKISTELIFGEGSAFNYGIQAGKGGFIIRNARVNGNIFGNGNLEGDNPNSLVTGSVAAANKPVDTPFPVNATPFPPDAGKSIIFGAQDNIQDVAQSFQTTGGVLSKIDVYIKDVGYPSNLTARIVENETGFNRPSSTTTAQSVLRSWWVTSKYGWIELYFPSDTYLEPNKTYWLVLDGSTNSESFYYWANNDASYGNGKPMLGKFGGSWSDAGNKDGYFKVYLEGPTKSFIDNLNIGSGTGEEAYAYEVKNSDINGSLYCQIGSNNIATSSQNINCDISRNDPDPQPFPISEGNIAKWKADAEEGGIIEGDYVASTTSQLGPVKINGNFTLGSNGITLTVTGTIWVTGNITIPNGSFIKLSPSYGSNSGLFIADGFINLDNGASFVGSGLESSYIMLLTTSNCPSSGYCGGNNAIEVRNVVDAVILNAQNGTIHFNNRSGAKEATAYRIDMENQSEVTYESGLTNVNFVSGPSGGFEIKSWREVE